MKKRVNVTGLCDKCKGPRRRKLGHSGMHRGVVYPFQEARWKKVSKERVLAPEVPVANGSLRTAREAITAEIELCDSRKAMLGESLKILDRL